MGNLIKKTFEKHPKNLKNTQNLRKNPKIEKSPKIIKKALKSF